MYGVLPVDRKNQSRRMTGAGISSLALAGQHNTQIARRAGEWLLQHPVGAWQLDKSGGDGNFGQAYSTALASLSLSPPYQVLPSYQR
jgi:hypothetical protein